MAFFLNCGFFYGTSVNQRTKLVEIVFVPSWLRSNALLLACQQLKTKTINLRITTKAEPCHRQIHDALEAKHNLLDKIKLIIDNKKSVVPTGPLENIDLLFLKR